MMGALWTCRSHGFPSWTAPKTSASPCLLHTGSGYAPFLDAFLKQIQPGSDEYIAEKYAASLEQPLNVWRDSFVAPTRDLRTVHAWLSEDLDGVGLGAAKTEPLRAKPPVESEKVSFSPAERLSREAFMEGLARYLGPFRKLEIAFR